MLISYTMKEPLLSDYLVTYLEQKSQQIADKKNLIVIWDQAFSRD